MPYVFYMFSSIFRTFSLTNLLTRCPVSVSIFCYFCISEKFLRKYSRKGLKIHGDQFLPGTEKMSEGDPKRSQGAPHACQAQAHPRPRLGVTWCPPGTPSHRLFACKLPFTLKISAMENFSTKHMQRRPHLESPI